MQGKTSAARLIKKAENIRDLEHRLKPNLRLKNKTEMIEFIHDKGLVSVLGGNELPSMISAVLGKPWRPSSKGFTGWLDWWSLKIGGQQLRRVMADIERRNDILATRMVGSTKTFVSNRLWPILDPIVRHQRELMREGKILSALDRKLLEIVEVKGLIRTDRLRRELKLEGKENNSKFHSSLNSLESYGLIVGAEDPKPERHMHANMWQTWEKRKGVTETKSNLSPESALLRLLSKMVDTCVLVRKDRIKRLFKWEVDMWADKTELLKSGEIAEADSYLVTARVFERTTH